MEQQNTEQKTILEQIAGNLGYFYQNGWDELFANGAVIQDAVLADIMRMAQNSDYAKDKGFADAKTKAASEFLKTFGLNKRTIIVTDGKDENVIKATNNIQKVTCQDASLLNVAQVVENTYLVFTKNAIKKLEEAYV